MALRCGIVGLPNVGKSTLFNALTALEIPAENYPFCTTEPNSGVVPVPDPRLRAVDAPVQAASVVPARVEFVDIAGLVRGASRGEGLGNQFLGHIRETSAIVHTVRCFEDPDVVHVDASVDPIRDVETVETELALADLDTVERRIERAQRSAKSGDKAAREELDFFERLQAHLTEGLAAHVFEVPEILESAFRQAHLLTAKPVLYAANVDEAALVEGNERTRALERHAAKSGAGCVRLCAKIEAELAQLEAEEKALFLGALGLEEPGLHRLIRETYRLLDLITFFTTGPKETRAWTIVRGTRTPQAAGEIHSDFERHFIRAEVIGYEDFVRSGGEAGAKARGRMRVEGRSYVLQDGDVVYFRVGQ